MKEQYKRAFFSESRRLHKSLQRYVHCHVTLIQFLSSLVLLLPMHAGLKDFELKVQNIQ